MKNAFLCALLVLASCAFSLGQTYKVLWSFGGAPNDGANPTSDFVFDGAGNMYGMTQWGGNTTNQLCGFGSVRGCGTVFERSPNSDGTWMETVLYSFCANSDLCLDGEDPMAGLTMDKQGNLYGTTLLRGLCPTTDQCSLRTTTTLTSNECVRTCRNKLAALSRRRYGFQI